MKDTTLDPRRLAEEATKADSKQFLRLLENVSHILFEEDSGKSSLKIFGRLIYLPSSGEAFVIGDIHGDLQSLIYILEDSNFLEKASKSRKVYLIFLGDYGDRGIYSPEVYYVLFKLKMMFPGKVIFLRGNHEGPSDLLAYPHDLPHQLKRRFEKDGVAIYRKLTAFFDLLHLAVLVKNKYIMLHGGVPSAAKKLKDVAYAHIKHPSESHLEEILWSDPAEGIRGIIFSPRGAGRLFGSDVTERFLNFVKAQLLIRGHEPADKGYKINHKGRVLTLFSRKGTPYFNSRGAYLHLDLVREIPNFKDIEDEINQF